MFVIVFDRRRLWVGSDAGVVPVLERAGLGSIIGPASLS